jgi:hypothetical protein
MRSSPEPVLETAGNSSYPIRSALWFSFEALFDGAETSTSETISAAKTAKNLSDLIFSSP